MEELLGGLKEFLSTDDGKKAAEAIKNMLGQADSQDIPQVDDQQELSEDMPDISKLVRLASIAGSVKADASATNLLLAIKPHLSRKRQERVDGAIKLLKLGALLPIIKETDILSEIL